MNKFIRNRTRLDYLKDKFENSFRKTDFLAEHVFNTPDRDLFRAFLDIISDPNTPYIFSNIAIAYREVPYTEELFQRITLKEDANNKKNSNKPTDRVYATTIPLDCKFYEIVYIKSPFGNKSGIPHKIIKNTLERLTTEIRPQYIVLEHVVRFLENLLLQPQQDLSVDKDDKTKEKPNPHQPKKEEPDPTADLFDVKGSPNIVLAPQLVDGKYYDVNGVKAYPFFSEKYHYYKTRLSQIQFNYKVWQSDGSTYTKRIAYFDVGEYQYTDIKTGEIIKRDIFYCKFFYKYYNPFMFFDLYEINDFMADMQNEPLTDEVKRILQNTYDAYVNDYGVGRKDVSTIKSITIYKADDKYFSKTESEDAREDEMESGITDDDKPDPIDLPVEDEKDEEEVESKSKKQQDGGVSRKILSLKTVKSLIMGYNGVKFYALYPHLGDILLTMTDNAYLNAKAGKTHSSQRSTSLLQSLQVFVTIKSNSDLFTFNTFANPFDFPCLLAYNRTIQYDAPKKQVVIKKTPPVKDRYLSFEEYGVLAPNTVKSTETAGIVLNINPFKCYANQIRTRKE